MKSKITLLLGLEATKYALIIVTMVHLGQDHLVTNVPYFLVWGFHKTDWPDHQIPSDPVDTNAKNPNARVHSQTMWNHLCALLQFWKNDSNSSLNGGYQHQPSELVKYIMVKVNLLLHEGFQIQWEDMMSNTPWLLAHLALTLQIDKILHAQPLPKYLQQIEQHFPFTRRL